MFQTHRLAVDDNRDVQRGLLSEGLEGIRELLAVNGTSGIGRLQNVSPCPCPKLLTLLILTLGSLFTPGTLKVAMERADMELLTPFRRTALLGALTELCRRGEESLAAIVKND